MTTTDDFNRQLSELCSRADRPYLAGRIREMIAELPPHPDTARADAAERMLRSIFDELDVRERRSLIRAIPSLETMWNYFVDDEVRKQLTARRDAARAEAARLDAELTALNGGKES